MGMHEKALYTNNSFCCLLVVIKICKRHEERDKHGKTKSTICNIFLISGFSCLQNRFNAVILIRLKLNG